MAEEQVCGGTLYVVATPIGNLEDISLRALRVLRQVALIAAEDTRHSRKLLAHYGIGTPLTSCYAHNEADKSAALLDRLHQGAAIALISDAGTPAISDPGALLVQHCIAAGIPVVPVPGPCAAIAALCAAGLPTGSFCFDGFLPAKSSARRRQLASYVGLQRTLVLYEAPHRLCACLRDIVEQLGELQPVAVARELTKRHEELFRGSAVEALRHFSTQPVRGEIVLLLAPVAIATPRLELAEAVRQLLEQGLALRQIARQLAADYDCSGSAIYALAQQLRDAQVSDESESR
ncbi:16S rRNA (cytidine(1402)-2'-O)-methyltransferase [Desulfuromonas thiophila]|uniref:Ribosomal RNA small subunit methyltransferase I n=1 Tax=Desulfuromonas thiophila TaxID=57664 RepID=A0A1G6YKH2_9BACT|nr:16S rRNA (cytidine(1402)-2'-O)-methyltransferase [Desulfuromonas thiophila]SDD90145.1 16S rRNA (cytidine1402-2'-O)-methyltransferase [Desulfuromonas thiophila]